MLVVDSRSFSFSRHDEVVVSYACCSFKEIQINNQ